MSTEMGVLIVEDEMLLAMDIEAMVEDSGHHVVAGAPCLQEVEAFADDLNPHLAFVDIHLARGSNGLDVCRCIQERWPQTLIVFVTANVAMIPPDFMGADGVIGKPFSHSGIVNAVKYIADGLLDPPPRGPMPASLIPSPRLKDRWLSTQGY